MDSEDMGVGMTPQERADSYHAAFPAFPPLRADDAWLDGSWVMGNDYKGSGYYGSYPPSYLRRVRAIVPDVADGRVLHLCAGSVSSDSAIRGVRLDIRQSVGPDVAGDAGQLPFSEGLFDLVLADLPYSQADAARYDTPMPNRRHVMSETARVTKAGGHLVWLDTVLPMFRKSEWRWWGAIGMWRSTNHRVRGVMCFERQEGTT